MRDASWQNCHYAECHFLLLCLMFMLSVIMLSVIMLSVGLLLLCRMALYWVSLCWVLGFYCYAECHYVECHYAECSYADFHSGRLWPCSQIRDLAWTGQTLVKYTLRRFYGTGLRFTFKLQIELKLTNCHKSFFFFLSKVKKWNSFRPKVCHNPWTNLS